VTAGFDANQQREVSTLVLEAAKHLADNYSGNENPEAYQKTQTSAGMVAQIRLPT